MKILRAHRVQPAEVGVWCRPELFGALRSTLRKIANYRDDKNVANGTHRLTDSPRGLHHEYERVVA
jgi:hypothetical protein